MLLWPPRKHKNAITEAGRACFIWGGCLFEGYSLSEFECGFCLSKSNTSVIERWGLGP